jgi:hypothetical protein
MLSIAEARIDCNLVDRATPALCRALKEHLLAGFRRDLPLALADAEIAGSGMAHIDRLAIAVRIDLAWSDTTIAHVIAEALLDGVEDALEAPDTVCFVDEADRIARFLIDHLARPI